MLFIDTDSLTYEIKSEDVYEEFFKWKDLFDFSNYPKDSKYFNETNKKVIGKMKDEFGGVIVEDGKEGNTTKGVNIATEFNEFKDAFFS